MGGTSANLKIPYPTGTDRVMDGDNAMQAIADRIDARMPYGWLGIAIPTTTTINPTKVSISGGTMDLTFPAGRRIRLSATMAFVAGTAGGVQQIGVLTINEGVYTNVPAATEMVVSDAMTLGGAGALLNVSCIITPTAGLHKYFLGGQTTGGTATAYAAANRPAYFLAEDIGPATIT